MDEEPEARNAGASHAHSRMELGSSRLEASRTVTDAAVARNGRDELLRELLGRVQAALQSDTATILLLSDDGQRLCVEASSGLEEEVSELVEIPVGRGIAGRIAAQRQPMIVEDLSGVKVVRTLLREKVKSLMGAPVVADDRLLGVIHVGSIAGRPFGQHDLMLLQIVADWAGAALEQARLYEAEREARLSAERSRDLIASLQAVTAGLSEAVTPDQVTKVILDQGLPAVGACAGSLTLLDADGQTLRVVGFRGYPEWAVEQWRSFPLDAAVPLAEVVRTAQPSFLETPEAWSSRYPEISRVTAGTGSRALAALPLTTEGQVLGAIGLSFAESHQFDEAERAFLTSLAFQGAQALSRARLYEALRQSDERLKMALRAARAVAWSWDLDAGHITRTDEHPEIYALPAIAKSDEAFALVHPDDQDRYRSTVEQAVREGGSYQSEFRITDPDTGNLVWLEERGEVRKEGTGKIPRMVGVAMDITERMHAGEALQAANARFRTLFDSNIIGILTANRSRIFEANDAFLDMVGYTRDDLAEEKISWRAMTPPEYAHLDDAALQEMLATGRATPFEKEYYHKDGRRVPILLGSGLLQREPQECVSFVVDITERKQADEERERLLAQVENERALLRAVLGQMPAAVQIAEAPSGKLILTNGRAATIWRCQFESLEELREWRQGRGFHSDGRPYERGEWPLVRSLTTGEVVMGEEIELLRGDGTRGLVATNSAPIRDERGNIVAAVSVYCDLTEQRRLEKLKDDFLAMASHELRTPITGVKGYSQLLLRKAAERGEDHPDKKIVQTIDRHCDRLTKLVDELLEVSRLNLGRLELRRDRFELSSLAAEAVDRLTLATTGHHLSFQSAGPAVVLADRDRLEQVLDNLITNAIRYSPGGGEIGVTLECRDGEAVVSVNDRGVGIPKHKQNRVFEHFYRAHAGSRHDHGGMGVGLYISQKIVQRHGGEMWFESEEGQGSTFYFSLPLCSELDSAS